MVDIAKCWIHSRNWLLQLNILYKNGEHKNPFAKLDVLNLYKFHIHLNLGEQMQEGDYNKRRQRREPKNRTSDE